MKSIIVTEKPSVALTFAEVLHVSGNHDGYIENEKWIITWCIGHLVTLSYPEAYDPILKEWSEETLPFLPEKYKYEVIQSVKNQFKVVKSLYNRNDIETIYYAGDPAREGIYIQALVRNMAGHNPSAEERVVWIDSQTEEEIKNGISSAKPFSDYDNLIHAGYERAVEDYATGINLSRMLSIRYGRIANNYAATKKYRPIAVGRVMSCVLGMVVKREREIEQFTVTPYYKIVNISDNVEAEWKAEEGSRMYESPFLYNEQGFKEENRAQIFLESLPAQVTIEKVEKRTEKKNAPLLFNLTELQAECSKRFKISPDETLQIAQSLYEKKLTTYPRTDARVLSSAIAKVIEPNLAGIMDNYPSKTSVFAAKILTADKYKEISDTRYTDDSKVSDHYAIIPTGEGYGCYDTLSDLEKQVYDLIVRRFLSIFFPPAEYEVEKIIEDAGGEKFHATLKKLSVPGYLEIAGIPSSDQEDESVFPAFREGEQLPASYSIRKGETTPPKRYTSGSMVLAMENAGNLIEDEDLRAQIKTTGIGTSATRAETIKKLVAQEYLSLNRKTQVLTPAVLGNIIYEIIDYTVPELLNPKMTASWEKGLEAIASGQIKAPAYRKIVEDNIRKEIQEIKEKNGTELNSRLERFKSKNASAAETIKTPCPVCGNPLKVTQYGCICSHYKKDATNEELEEKTACRFGIGQIAGKSLSAKDIDLLLSTGKTGELTGFLSKKGTQFSAKLQFTMETTDGILRPKIQFLFNQPEESTFECPKCGKKLLKDKWSYTCDCGYRLAHTIAQKKIPDTEIKLLLSGKETKEIKGFVSKKGKKFNAKLRAGEDGKVEFIFDKK